MEASGGYGNKVMPKGKLTAKQEAFKQAYLVNGFNATQAAITAKYSKRTAYSQGQRLLKHVEIKKAIQEAQAKAAERNEVEIDSQLEYTKGIRKRAKDVVDFRSELTANDQVSKIAGSYAPTKVDHTHDVKEKTEAELRKRLQELRAKKAKRE